MEYLQENTGSIRIKEVMAETMLIKEEPTTGYDNIFYPEQAESTNIPSLFIKKEDSSEVPCECATHQVHGANSEPTHNHINCECDIKQEDGDYHNVNGHTSMENDNDFGQNENCSEIKQEISAEGDDPYIEGYGHHSTSSGISTENGNSERNLTQLALTMNSKLYYRFL